MQQIEHAFNDMTTSLHALVKEISTSSEYVSASSEELHAGVEETTHSIVHVTEMMNEVADDAKKQTTELSNSQLALTNMTADVQAIVTNSDEVSKLARQTTQLSHETSVKFAHIVQSMEQLEQQVLHISANATEVSSSTRNVVTAIDSMKEISYRNVTVSQEVASATEEQTASMEEVSASATELAKMAETLQALIRSFKL